MRKERGMEGRIERAREGDREGEPGKVRAKGRTAESVREGRVRRIQRTEREWAGKDMGKEYGWERVGKETNIKRKREKK